MIHALGFPRWKRAPLRQCFPGRALRFVDDPARLPDEAEIAVWSLSPLAPPPGARWRIWRVEDGFLRSVGLGAELRRPLSWVVDGGGLHFDPRQPSDLETLLATGDFDAALLARAASLRAAIVAARLTKYNVGAGAWRRPAAARRVVLVAGQVESDASLRHAAPAIRRNIDLLRAARAAEPGAHLVYKVHPDVAAGLRAAGDGEDNAAALCDEVVTDAPIDALIDGADAVHVLTSLAGFEALLRGRDVVCHGQPFYAGWGLTQDRAPPPRRGRPLTLDALVAAALILYPRYLDPRGTGLIAPEAAIAWLMARKARRGGAPEWWTGPWRALLRRIGRP
jgi:capsular polysaccharide export protein